MLWCRLATSKRPTPGSFMWGFSDNVLQTRAWSSNSRACPCSEGPPYPMILPVHSLVRESIVAILRSRYGLEGPDAPGVALEYPPSRELGDLSTPVAFELAKRLRKAPKMIAQEIADALAGVDGVARVTAV